VCCCFCVSIALCSLKRAAAVRPTGDQASSRHPGQLGKVVVTKETAGMNYAACGYAGAKVLLLVVAQASLVVCLI
jgi:hypothetical protein